MVLATFAETKVARRTGAKPRSALEKEKCTNQAFGCRAETRRLLFLKLMIEKRIT